MLIAALQTFIAADLYGNPKKLGEGIGTDVRNLDTRQGDFRGWPQPLVVHPLVGVGAQPFSIYRMGRDTESTSAYWLAPSSDTDWVRSMLATDPLERTYYTSDAHGPRFTDNTFLGAPPYPNGFYSLGIQRPPGTFSLSIASTGTGTVQDRVYLQTFVRDNGDEGAPGSSPATISARSDATVNITSLDAPASGQHGITRRRIYVSTGGSYQRCADIDVALTSTVDTGERGLVLETAQSDGSLAYLVPPNELRGLRGLWNGMMVGFYGKAYRVCVPYKPHAWPIEYEYILDDTIIGMDTWGNNLLIVTTGRPQVTSGSAPRNMQARPIFFSQGGVSKRSVKSVGHGVCWASRDGLCYYGELGMKVLTAPFLSSAQWRALAPETILGARYRNFYVGFYNNGDRRSFMIDTVDPKGIIWLDSAAFAAFEDPLSQSLFTCNGSLQIEKWDAGDPADAVFSTGIITHPQVTNPGAARIVASQYPVTMTLFANVRSQAAPNGAWTQVFTRLVTSQEPFTLPSNYVAREFRVTLQGKGPVEACFIGELMGDLPGAA